MLTIMMMLLALLFAGCANEAPAPAQVATNSAPVAADTAAADTAAPPPRVDVQQVNLKISGGDYQPASISVKPGKQIRLTVTRDDKPTCGEILVIPSANIRQEIPVNQTVAVDIPPQQSGKLEFTCGMNMMKGTIVVE